ncbi:MAG: hypothetical protein F6K28_50715 [Microcoleus sp. SIO2G3]|nr:hypothetical protein [Microcoleus sp. SIO2G3]
MTRQDNWLLTVLPLSSEQSGLLSVSLDEATNLNDTQGTLRIQSNGQVFLN